MMHNIVICDDHPIVRNGLKCLINDEFDMQVVGEASNVDELFELLKNLDVNQLLLDISMPGLTGFDALYKIKTHYPFLKVLMLSALSEDAYALKSLKAGADGFLNKESSPEELIKAIHKIQQDRIYISQVISDKLALDFKDDNHQPLHKRLSEREFQVLTLIGKGEKTADIADALSLSVKTISTYRTRLLEKMDLKCNSEIIKYCITESLIE